MDRANFKILFFLLTGVTLATPSFAEPPIPLLTEKRYENGKLKEETLGTEAQELRVRYSESGQILYDEHQTPDYERRNIRDDKGRTVVSELSYAGGSRGIREEYSSRGTLQLKELFRNGKRVGRILYDPHGRVIRSEAFHDDGSRK